MGQDFFYFIHKICEKNDGAYNTLEKEKKGVGSQEGLYDALGGDHLIYNVGRVKERARKYKLRLTRT
jgi:hypothetical protein